MIQVVATTDEPGLVEVGCRSLNVPLVTYYRVIRGQGYDPRRPRRPPRAWTASQQATVLAILHEPRFVDLAPPQVQARLLHEATYICSVRTM